MASRIQQMPVEERRKQAMVLGCEMNWSGKKVRKILVDSADPSPKCRSADAVNNNSREKWGPRIIRSGSRQYRRRQFTRDTIAEVPGRLSSMVECW